MHYGENDNDWARTSSTDCVNLVIRFLFERMTRLEAALEEVDATDGWQFEEAWASVARPEALQSYPDAIRRAAGARRR